MDNNEGYGRVKAKLEASLQIHDDLMGIENEMTIEVVLTMAGHFINHNKIPEAKDQLLRAYNVLAKRYFCERVSLSLF